MCAILSTNIIISVAIPHNNEKLKQLVLMLRQHKHSSYCKRGRGCRFSFPQPPIDKTLIAYPIDDEDTDTVYINTSNVLSKVRKQLFEGGDNDINLDELLKLTNISYAVYKNAVSTSSKGNVIVLKRKPNECKINNYNPAVMSAWQANMDIQYVLNAYACVMYVASYMMKSEKAMGELLKTVINENRSDELKSQLRKVGSAFLTHREVSAQEAVYRILSIPMKQLSRTVLYVDTNPAKDRIAVLKKITDINQLDDDDPNVFHKSLLERYQHRPRTLDQMCLAEFAANYVTSYQADDDSMMYYHNMMILISLQAQ